MHPHLQRAVRDRPETDALQPDDRVADRLAHVAHLTGPSFVERDGEQRLVFAGPQARVQQSDDGRGGAPAFDGHAAAQALERALVGHAAHARVVLPLDLVARMQEPRREVPVVRQEQQALRVVVEAAHRVDVLPHLREEVEDRRPALRVLPRRHVAARLVEQHVAVAHRRPHTLAVDAYVVARGIGARAQFEHRDAVHRHPAVHDQGFRRAPR